MQFKSILLIISVLMSLNAMAQSDAKSKKTADKTAIKKMCGCFEVGFNFAETFNYSSDSTYKPSKKKEEKALEWVETVEEDDNKLVLQHLLIVGKDDKPYIVKHWRQDWLYENTDLYMFDVNKRWKFVQLPQNQVKGQWTQKVFQVDDSPRYEGSATWVHVDEKSYWENTTDAPLPRREHTKRDDYNVTIRGNRHEITEFGWIHDQDNKKVIRESGKADIILAEEKGYNTYTKVEDSRCKAAQQWWKKNHKMWGKVRTKWSEVFAQNKSLELHNSVNDKKLFEYLFDEDVKEVEKIIESFVKK